MDASEKNFEAFVRDLQNLDSRIKKVLTPFKGQKFYVFHPSFGYFSDAYGLTQVAVESGGKHPGPKYLATIIKMAKQDRVNVIFVQPQFDKKSARTIANAIGGTVVLIDPLAKDYINNLDNMTKKIEQAFKK